MEVIKKPFERDVCLLQLNLPQKNSNIRLSKCKKTNQAAIIQWQRQCLMYKAHRKPCPKSKTSDISKQSPSPLHHTFLLGRARFTAQPLSALIFLLGLTVSANRD